MDLTRLWIFLGIFVVLFPLLYWQLKREQEAGVPDPGEGLIRGVERQSASISFIVALILIGVGLAQGQLLVLAAALFLFAFALWRLRTARDL
jgi:uncharacterized Tic20 family protein